MQIVLMEQELARLREQNEASSPPVVSHDTPSAAGRLLSKVIQDFSVVGSCSDTNITHAAGGTDVSLSLNFLVWNAVSLVPLACDR
jgi:hypothetical protein